LIRATKDLAIKLEERLRHNYDVQSSILDGHDDKNEVNIDVCEIKANVRRDWIALEDLHPMRI
jgi:hypothetical protein